MGILHDGSSASRTSSPNESSSTARPVPDSAIEPSDIHIDMREVWTRVDRLSYPIAKFIQDTFPGCNFGLCKFNHMQDLANEFLDPAMAPRHLNAREICLSAITARCHDLGRHLQELEYRGYGDKLKIPIFGVSKLDNTLDELLVGLRDYAKEQPSGHKSFERLHGLAGRRFVEAFRILDVAATITDVEKAAILAAVEWHNQKHVDLPRQSLAWRLCYALRDHDKEEILTDVPGYLGTEGAVRQLGHFFLGYCPELDKVQVDLLRGASSESDIPTVQQALRAAAFGLGDGCALPAGEKWEVIPQYVFEFLRGIRSIDRGLTSKPDLSRAVAVFEKHQTLETDRGTRLVSYPYYMLATVAMLFDVENPQTVERVVGHQGFQLRLAYLERTMERAQFKQVESALGHYLETKIGNPTFTHSVRQPTEQEN